MQYTEVSLSHCVLLQISAMIAFEVPPMRFNEICVIALSACLQTPALQQLDETMGRV